MSPEQRFGVSNGIAALGWILLAALPRRRWATEVVTGVTLPAAFAILYVTMLIGTWEARDARDRGVPQLLLIVCLFLTFLFGPAGWLLYMGVRRGWAPAKG